MLDHSGLENKFDGLKALKTWNSWYNQNNFEKIMIFMDIGINLPLPYRFNNSLEMCVKRFRG